VRGLCTLEPDPEKQLKYLEFIDIYSGLDAEEQARYAQDYPEEAKMMSTFAERFIEQGLQQGLQRGLQQGEAQMLLSLLERKFGQVPEALRQRIEAADVETLLEWSERVLTAQYLDEIVD
jgi:flagellar biosynthesis/type III secretory pathway protein FliH